VYTLADTGANNFVVQSSLLPKNLQSNIPIYDPKKSSTARQLPGYTYSEGFNDYQDNGVVYNDVVTFGGVKFQNISVCTMTNATRASGDNSRAGNFGLDLTQVQSTNPAGTVKSFMYAIRSVLDGKQHPPDLSILSSATPADHSIAGILSITFNNTVGAESGTFDFGYVDTAKYTGSVSFATSNDAGFFMVPAVGQYIKGVLKPANWNIIVDSGTLDSRVPISVATAYHAQVNGSQYNADWDLWIYPCSATLPDFKVKLANGITITWPGKYLKSSWQWFDNGVTCVSWLRQGPEGSNLIVGETFLMGNFVVFDYDKKRVGFAAKTSPGAPRGIPPTL